MNMDWIPSFLKDLKLSKSLCVAIFLASGFLLFMPSIAPNYSLMPVPKEYLFPLYSLFVTAGFICLLWSFDIAKGVVSTFLEKNKKRLKAIYLSQDEKDWLFYMGENCGDSGFELSRIKTENKLKFLEIIESLESKGFLYRGGWRNETLLTISGRKKALELMRNSEE